MTKAAHLMHPLQVLI